MTTHETQRPAGAAPDAQIRSALQRYRVMAWVTGVWLLVLCGELVSHYAFHHPVIWITQVHGLFYFIYVLVAFNLAIKVRWPIGKTIGVLLAGTIPLLGIIVEHFQTRNVRAQFDL
jgi:integral membrane protein